jgi:hypothetical protein
MSGKSLAEYRLQAQDNGEPKFVGNLAYLAREYSQAAHAADMWNLTIVLYTRSASNTFVAVVVAYFGGFVLYWLAAALLTGTSAQIDTTHDIYGSLLRDSLLAVLSFLAVFFVMDYTFIGAGFSDDQGRLYETVWITVCVLLISLLSGFVQLYRNLISLLVIMGAIWIGYGANSSRTAPRPEYGLYVALRASLFVLVYYAAFLAPLRKSYADNAFFAVGIVVAMSSLLQFVYEQS